MKFLNIWFKIVHQHSGKIPITRFIIDYYTRTIKRKLLNTRSIMNYYTRAMKRKPVNTCFKINRYIYVIKRDPPAHFYSAFVFKWGTLLLRCRFNKLLLCPSFKLMGYLMKVLFKFELKGYSPRDHTLGDRIFLMKLCHKTFNK